MKKKKELRTGERRTLSQQNKRKKGMGGGENLDRLNSLKEKETQHKWGWGGGVGGVPRSPKRTKRNRGNIWNNGNGRGLPSTEKRSSSSYEGLQEGKKGGSIMGRNMTT